KQAPLVYSADHFVLAAGAWSGELAASLNLPLPVKPCRGQMIEFEGAIEFPCTVRAGHFYCVPRSGGRLIAGSTMEYAGFEKAVTAEGLLSILERACRLVPSLAGQRFRRAWAGLRPDTPDHWPILGYGAWTNLVFATGHFRNGILLTPITARLISELIVTGSASINLQPYSPTRFH
ncbi:MAG TPA: FAD-dependent oxidoreductase, partial [Terriglobia bacterium]|nr:FAD-dependent oxidoreductase [Terriglobia bacterium]